ncbi:MAG: PAS domain S-box protein [Polyangiaceae bacterium]
MGQVDEENARLRHEVELLQRENELLRAHMAPRREGLSSGEIELLEAISSGVSLPAILERLVLIAEQKFPGMLGSVLLLDDERKRLRHGAAPSLPVAYTKAIDGVPIGPHVASCGSAAHRGTRVIVEDIEHNPLWKDYRALALTHGLKACWSTPILSDEQQVVGTFALYYREPRQPTDAELDAMARSAHLASIAIRHQHMLDALRRSEYFARESLDALSAHIAIIDGSGKIIAVNRAWRQFAQNNEGSLANVCEGVNYLNVCAQATDTAQADAQKIADGIREIVMGSRNELVMEYPCHSPTEQRWYMARITKFSTPTHDTEPRIAIVHDDISSRYRAEEALRTSEALYRSVVESVREGIVVQERSGRISAVNRSAERLLRLSADELLRATSSDPRWQAIREDGSALQGDEHPAMVALRTGEPVHDFIMGLRHVEGETVWLSVNSRPIYEESEHQPIRVVSTFLDITEKRAAELERQRVAQHLRTMIETEPECVKVVARNGELLEMNPAGLAMLEVSSLEEAKQQPLLDFIKPAYQQRYTELHHRALHGEIGQLVFEITTRKGTSRWVETHVAPMREPDGSITHVLAVTRDISTRRQAEEALRESEEQLSAIIDSAMDAILSLDAEDRIVVFNPAAQQMFGISREEALGQPLNKFLPTGLAPVREGEKEHTSSPSQALDKLTQLQARRTNGETFSVEASVSHSQVRGRSLRTAILRDVTARERLQSQVLQARKMESLGRLAGGIAHDFNNLLTVINCFIELAVERVDTEDQSPRHVLEPLDEIRAASNRAATLTRQLLAFSRRQIVQVSSLDLDKLIADMSKMLERLIGEDISLDLHTNTGLHRIKGDPGQLEQVLMNLVINARDAMPRGGRLELEVSSCTIDGSDLSLPLSAPPGKYVQLTVTDNGVGMDSTVLQHMFDPFFTTKSVGTGLGLSTVHGIVTQHRGFIHVESEVGRGSTFKLFFPEAVEESPDSSHNRVVLSHTGTETILLVEDEQQLREVVSRVLKRAGYNVIVASKGEDALALLDSLNTKLDLLFTDVVMPGMSGRELAEEVEKRLPHTKVLYASGYTEDTVLRHGIQTETMQFIAKPYGVSDLFKKIREVLGAS